MKASHNITILLTAALLFTSCKPKVVDVKPDEPTDPEKHETITLGGGCYWCVEAVFQQLDGVISATSGFMGGHIPNPSSEEVYSQTSGHIEVVQVVFDPDKISTPEILKWFWKAHNPTDPEGQGVDKGSIYMSHIFAHSPNSANLQKPQERKPKQILTRQLSLQFETQRNSTRQKRSIKTTTFEKREKILTARNKLRPS
jgi:peptide-methionine (S)-S-oxide reductase